MKLNKFLYIFACAAALAAGAVRVSHAAPAPEKSGEKAESASPVPAVLPITGDYLAAQHARANGNLGEAIRLLRRVHRKMPDEIDVTLQLEGMLLLSGQFDEAARLAQRIKAGNAKDPLADLLLTVQSVKAGRINEAQLRLKGAAGKKGNTQLWVPLISAWMDTARAPAAKKPVTAESLGLSPSRVAPLVHYHLALLNEYAGFTDAAAEHFKSAIDDPQDPPARLMKALLAFYDRRHAPKALVPLVTAYRQSHPEEAGALPAAIATPQEGVAEVLYTMGGVMFGAGVINDAAIYLQLAAYIRPGFDDAVMSLGDAYAEIKQYEFSNDMYGRIAPESPVYGKARMHIAVNHDRMGKHEEALAMLDALAAKSPRSSDALVTKGDLLRIHRRYTEASAAYTEALKRIPELQPRHWPILFARGSCLERQGQWPQAEADLRRALELKPDQPDILNYLGYGWIEQGTNIVQARAMIEKAVKIRPNDPQIVDSMGWVLFLQGEYKEATGYLEKAVELLPSDATVNDHLGDAYWRMGRRNEARFQWERALTFSPEEKLAEAIGLKLKEGLPPATLAKSEADKVAAAQANATP